jgi:iron complex outermembrane receptor protein
MQPRSALSTIITALLSLSGPAVTHAIAGSANAADSTVASGGGESLEEIEVVAQKQNIDLQKAPVAITALAGDSLAQLNIVNPIDLNGQVPGLVITQSEGYNRSVSIRGIGFNVPQDDSAQTSVSYHEDGIYIAFPVALDSGFLDVDHVEVLRGPQGTVFGQNAVGGTINVISKLPTFDAINGFVDASAGSYNLEHLTAAINIPLSSSFAIRAAVDEISERGYVKAIDVPGDPGFDLNNQHSWHARLQALWQANDDLSVLLRAEYAQAHQHEASGKNINDPNTDPYQQSSDWPGEMNYNQQLAAATITYNLPAATLKVLSSYQEVNHHGSVNEDGESLALITSQGSPHDVEWFEHNSKSLTEEINLGSKPGGALDWIVGAFYLKSITTVAYDQYNLFGGEPTFNGTSSPDLLSVPETTVNNPNSALGQFITNAIYNGTLYFQNFGAENRDSASVYGQGIWHVTDTLRFTAGLRYTHDHNTTWFDDYYDLFPPGHAIFYEQTSDKPTWRLALDYDLTATNLLYGSVSTGFKPGGGNISNCPSGAPVGSGCPITAYPNGEPYQFQPETITAYEIGSKNSLLDKKLNLNLAAFLYQDKDMQYQGDDLIPYQGGVGNIPNVRITGLEGEMAALLPWNLRVDSNATWEHGSITSHFFALDNFSGNAANNAFLSLPGITYADFIDAYSNPTGANGVLLQSYRKKAYFDVYGNAPPSLPSLIATINLSHTLALPGESSLLSRLSAQYRSDYATTIFGKTPIYTAPSYTMFNLFFDYVLAPHSWDFSLAVNNLFDRAQVASRFTNQFGAETTQVYAPPREFVVGAHYKF